MKIGIDYEYINRVKRRWCIRMRKFVSLFLCCKVWGVGVVYKAAVMLGGVNLS